MIEPLLAALTLSGGYNSAMAVITASMLGCCGAVLGCFLVLRKQALLGDTLSHATLPGIGLAFLVSLAWGDGGRSLPVLVLGATCSAALAMVLVDLLTRHTRLPPDAVLGAVASVFYGFGIVVLTIIQNLNVSGRAGLGNYLLGSLAGTNRSEATIMTVAAMVVLLAAFVLRRPMMVTIFDPDFAATGLRLRRLSDWTLLGLVLAIIVIGVKTVGLILMVALLIIPAVTARLWADRFSRMIVIAAILGALCGYFGTALSASASGLPAGPVIVLLSFSLFLFSLLFAPAGLCRHMLNHRRFRHEIRTKLARLAHHQSITNNTER